MSAPCAGLRRPRAGAAPDREAVTRARASWPPPPPTGRRPADIVRCRACAATCRSPSFRPARRWTRPTARSPRAPTSTRRPASAPPRARALDRIERHTGGAGSDLRPRLLGGLPARRGRAARLVGARRGAVGVRRATSRASAWASTCRPARSRRPTCRAGAFDCVVMGDVIEHLPDPGAALDRITGLLRPRRGPLPRPARRRQRGGAAARSPLVVGAPHPRAVLHPLEHGAAARPSTGSRSSGWAPPRRPSPCATTSSGWRATRSRSPRAAVAGARGVRLADRLVWPDFRDRMAVVARGPRLVSARVAVIGAGVAGLTAAYELGKAGVELRRLRALAGARAARPPRSTWATACCSSATTTTSSRATATSRTSTASWACPTASSGGPRAWRSSPVARAIRSPRPATCCASRR